MLHFKKNQAFNFLKLGLALYLVSIFFLSASKNFLFFVDSKTYINGHYEFGISELLTLHPVGFAVVAIYNLNYIYRIFAVKRAIWILFFFHPYVLLLITNVTKESLIFLLISIFVRRRSFQSVVGRILSSSAIIFLIWRPHYIVVLTEYIKLKQKFLLLIPVTLYAIYKLLPYMELVFTKLLLRSRGTHTGRDYFNELCYEQKGDIFELISCATQTFFLFPPHDDLLTENYLIFFSIQITFLLLFMRYLFKAKIAAVVLYTSFLLLLWWGPTLGAAQRYFIPIMFFYILNEVQKMYTTKNA